MSMIEKFAQGHVSARLPVASERLLVTTILLAFLFLHVIAGMILQRTAAGAPAAPQQQETLSLYD